MNRSPIRISFSLCLVFILAVVSIAAAQGQAPANNQANNQASNQDGTPVSYASINQLNGMLSQLEQASQTTQVDLAKLRIERWKTDSDTRRQLQSNEDSIARNLQAALPEIIGQLRAAPENSAITFKLYRNLSALYDVLNEVTESAGAFGSKDEYQELANDLSSFDAARRSFGDRTASLTNAKEAELGRLHTELRQAQAIINSAPPKKTVVDDNEPEKKPKSKTSHAAAKKPVHAKTPPTTQKPAASQKPAATQKPATTQNPSK